MADDRPMIDVIRDGVPPAALKRSRCGGDCAVFRALVSTAASAQLRGWDLWEWEALLSDDPRSQLGRQARIENMRPLNDRRYRKRLQAAWEAAEQWLADRPDRWTSEQIAAHIADVRQFVADAPMTEDERAVMVCACDFAAKYGTDRPAMPWRAVRTETGLGPSRTRTILAQLCEIDLLTLARHGGYRSGGRSKANLYKLPSPAAMTSYLYRVTRSMDDVPRSMDDPQSKIMDGAQIYGRGDGMDKITITGSAEALAQLLELARTNGVPVAPERSELPDNVTPIRRSS
jgi:hypothetical protein